MLSKINPRLIYAASSGFGQTGPLSKYPAYDTIVQAMSGIMSLTGKTDGPPTRVGTSISDLLGGVLFGIAMLALGTALAPEATRAPSKRAAVAAAENP